MKSKWIAAIGLTAVMMVTGCAAQSAVAKYESPQGWSVSYDSSLFEVTEDDGTNFTYKGEADGTNRIRVSYYQDKMPDEVLYEVMENADEMPEHTRSEGYFAGRTDVWSIRTSMASQAVPGATEDFIAVERNGGTLLVQITTTAQADDATGIGVSDALAAIVDSFEQLNEDHTGVISMQDEIPVIWYSREGKILNAETSEQIYEYTVEGDTLYLTDPAESESEEPVTFEFTREAAKE